MSNAATRQEVYQAIDSERDYQDHVWGKDESTAGGDHTVEDFVVYIDVYLAKVKEATMLPKAKRHLEMMNIMRKITALGVRCMEQHGAPLRGLTR